MRESCLLNFFFFLQNWHEPKNANEVLLGLQKCYSFSVQVSLNIFLWRRDAWPTPKHIAHLAHYSGLFREVFG